MMRPIATIIPRIRAKFGAQVFWPKKFKAQRVAMCFIDLAESGHIRIPLEQVVVLLRQRKYRRIAGAIEEQIRADRVPKLLGFNKDDALGKRMLIKGFIAEDKGAATADIPAHRSGECLVLLSEIGIVNVHVDRLIEFLKAKGYPQLAHAVDDHVLTRRLLH